MADAIIDAIYDTRRAADINDPSQRITDMILTENTEGLKSMFYGILYNGNYELGKTLLDMYDFNQLDYDDFHGDFADGLDQSLYQLNGHILDLESRLENYYTSSNDLIYEYNDACELFHLVMCRITIARNLPSVREIRANGESNFSLITNFDFDYDTMFVC